MRAAVLWPVKDTTPFRLLLDLINGRTVWAPLATPPARVREFDGAILELRLLGWPLIGSPKPDAATGFEYSLPEENQLAAIADIKRRIAAKG